MFFFKKTPWWKDRRKGWPGRGIGDFWAESETSAEAKDIEKAIDVLQWGIRFSRETGSGGGTREMEEMIKSLKNHL